ncbi:MAG: hypothetical protein AB7O28_02875 [Vicinamibacterales bacterium]
MTFDLDDSTAARRADAERIARDVVAPAADALDTSLALRDETRGAIAAVLPSPGDPAIGWVVALEAVAAASAGLALVAAADRLGVRTAVGASEWSGCRGVDLDAMRAALAASRPWQLAVTATLVGAGRAAVDAAVLALRTRREAGAPDLAAQPAVADAATAIDASRLLLWEAATTGAAAAGHLARLHVLDALKTALSAVEESAGSDAFRSGTPLDRLRRDVLTVATVFGEAAAAREALAAASPA